MEAEKEYKENKMPNDIVSESWKLIVSFKELQKTGDRRGSFHSYFS